MAKLAKQISVRSFEAGREVALLRLVLNQKVQRLRGHEQKLLREGLAELVSIQQIRCEQHVQDAQQPVRTSEVLLVVKLVAKPKISRQGLLQIFKAQIRLVAAHALNHNQLSNAHSHLGQVQRKFFRHTAVELKMLLEPEQAVEKPRHA